MVVLWQKWLYKGKVFVMGKNDCTRAKVELFGKTGSTRAEKVLIGQ